MVGFAFKWAWNEWKKKKIELNIIVMKWCPLYNGYYIALLNDQKK